MYIRHCLNIGARAGIDKQPEKDIIVPSFEPPKRAYRKLNIEYWQKKTQKSIRRKECKAQVRYNAGILGRASKIGSTLYAHIPHKHKCREVYRQLTAWAMRLLRDEWDEAEIFAELLPTLPTDQSPQCGQSDTKTNGGFVVHPKGQYYFIASPYKRIVAEPIALLQISCYHPILLAENSSAII